MSSYDVTALVRVGAVDDESVPLERCVCGARFETWRGPILSIYADDPTECPSCGRRLYFQSSVRVYEVKP
jgi:DNA-directed RNA polymerase subunit RPC12/RpoP